MKIAFPVQTDEGMESQVYNHFGSASTFLVVDSESGATESVGNADLNHIHGQCQPLAALNGAVVDGIVVGGIGRGALNKLRRAHHKKHSFEDIVSKNHKMLQLFAILPQIARSHSTVLIEGPGGIGKELFARAIHSHSPRRKAPFVAVHCGALPDTLIESELFGYQAGAFTDFSNTLHRVRLNWPGLWRSR